MLDRLQVSTKLSQQQKGMLCLFFNANMIKCAMQTSKYKLPLIITALSKHGCF